MWPEICFPPLRFFFSVFIQLGKVAQRDSRLRTQTMSVHPKQTSRPTVAISSFYLYNCAFFVGGVRALKGSHGDPSPSFPFITPGPASRVEKHGSWLVSIPLGAGSWVRNTDVLAIWRHGDFLFLPHSGYLRYCNQKLYVALKEFPSIHCNAKIHFRYLLVIFNDNLKKKSPHTFLL